jgi:hypothetical protein
MTAQELLQYEIDGVGFQLHAIIDTMPSSVQDEKLTDGGMSPKEMLGHVAEAYHATCAHCKGETHEWGSYSVGDQTWDGLLKNFWTERDAAAKAALGGDEKAVKAGYDYIVSHDSYHVGQLALLRMKHDSTWDPYSIYHG